LIWIKDYHRTQWSADNGQAAERRAVSHGFVWTAVGVHYAAVLATVVGERAAH